MPEQGYPDPREEDIVYEDRRISRPDSSLPDWWVSDPAYRPIPIAWFAGATVLQVILQPLLFMIFAVGFGTPRMVTIAIAALASGLIWHLAMQRGMAQASVAWRFATGTMLAFFFSITALTALA